MSGPPVEIGGRKPHYINGRTEQKSRSLSGLESPRAAEPNS